jgi:hypothetical protein
MAKAEYLRKIHDKFERRRQRAAERSVAEYFHPLDHGCSHLSAQLMHSITTLMWYAIGWLIPVMLNRLKPRLYLKR